MPPGPGGLRAPGASLERRPPGVDLPQCLDGHLPDPGALVGLRLDEPHCLEVSEGFAHRCLAHAELGREHALLDPVAGPVGAVEDALDDAVLDLVTQDAVALQWLIHSLPLG